MVAQIKMPALSPTMTEGKLSKWLIQKSSKVVSGDVIAEIETDKATMEIEAVDDGVLYEIFVEEGTVEFSNNTLIILSSTITSLENFKNQNISKIIEESKKFIYPF